MKTRMNMMWSLAAAVAFVIAATSASAVTIDDFDTPNVQMLENHAVGVYHNSADAPTALGGERDMILTVTEGSGTFLQTSELMAGSDALGSLWFSQPGVMTASATIIWDGDDDDALVTNPTGLGGVDLTEAGKHDRFGFGTNLVDQEDVVVQMTVYTDADHVSVGSITLDKTFAYMLQTLAYDDFVATGALGGADFTNVGAIELYIDGSQVEALDLQMDLIVTAANPEPTTTLLGTLALGGIGMVFGRRRRQA